MVGYVFHSPVNPAAYPAVKDKNVKIGVGETMTIPYGTTFDGNINLGGGTLIIAGTFSRITSYNVCYTKLLRSFGVVRSCPKG